MARKGRIVLWVRLLNLSQGSIFWGAHYCKSSYFVQKKLRQQATFLISRIFWYFRNFREIPHFFYIWDISIWFSRTFWNLWTLKINFPQLLTFGEFQFEFSRTFWYFSISETFRIFYIWVSIWFYRTFWNLWTVNFNFPHSMTFGEFQFGFSHTFLLKSIR